MLKISKNDWKQKHGPPASNHAEVSKAACDIGFGAVRPLERPSWLEKLPANSTTDVIQHISFNSVERLRIQTIIYIDIFVIYICMIYELITYVPCICIHICHVKIHVCSSMYIYVYTLYIFIEGPVTPNHGLDNMRTNVYQCIFKRRHRAFARSVGACRPLNTIPISGSVWYREIGRASGFLHSSLPKSSDKELTTQDTKGYPTQAPFLYVAFSLPALLLFLLLSYLLVGS